LFSNNYLNFLSKTYINWLKKILAWFLRRRKSRHSSFIQMLTIKEVLLQVLLRSKRFHYKFYLYHDAKDKVDWRHFQFIFFGYWFIRFFGLFILNWLLVVHRNNIVKYCHQGSIIWGVKINSQYWSRYWVKLNFIYRSIIMWYFSYLNENTCILLYVLNVKVITTSMALTVFTDW